MGALMDQLRAMMGTVAPGPYARVIDADRELAELLGPEGARREFLGAAVHLVGNFSCEPWPEAEALDDLRRWWGRPLETLTPTEWIVSAAHADEVRTFSAEGDQR